MGAFRISVLKKNTYTFEPAIGVSRLTLWQGQMVVIWLQGAITRTCWLCNGSKRDLLSVFSVITFFIKTVEEVWRSKRKRCHMCRPCAWPLILSKYWNLFYLCASKYVHVPKKPDGVQSVCMRLFVHDLLLVCRFNN